jgi:hypothetical protein
MLAVYTLIHRHEYNIYVMSFIEYISDSKLMTSLNTKKKAFSVSALEWRGEERGSREIGCEMGHYAGTVPVLIGCV